MDRVDADQRDAALVMDRVAHTGGDAAVFGRFLVRFNFEGACLFLFWPG